MKLFDFSNMRARPLQHQDGNRCHHLKLYEFRKNSPPAFCILMSRRVKFASYTSLALPCEDKTEDRRTHHRPFEDGNFGDD